MWLQILALLLCAAVGAYLFLLNKFSYWKKRGVVHLKPSLFGNYNDFFCFKKNQGEVERDICLQFPDAPFVGSYFATEPVLIVKDPELLKLVTTKEFYFFNGRETSNQTRKELFTRNLFHESGDYWKVARQNLTPLFSSAKMKNMFHLIEKCNEVLENNLAKEADGVKTHEMKTFMARYTIDCIGSCAFGIDTNVMGDRTDKNPFKIIGDKIFDTSPLRMTMISLKRTYPSIFYGLGLKTMPTKVSNFFSGVLKKVSEDRNHTPSARHDFVDLMLSLKQKKVIEGDAMRHPLKAETEHAKATILADDAFLIAQCVIFFAAGFDTSATTLSFTIFELAKNQDVQKKARDEVLAYLEQTQGKLDYSCTNELPYLEACIDEALRKYPVAPMLTREVVENYKLPSGLVLEKGLRVHYVSYYFHMNPEYFPEPEEYRPERFYKDAKKNIKPYTYFPFGEGPRTCIGMRFAKMQMLSGLVTLLKKYRVELAPGMPQTLSLDPLSPITSSKSGINVVFVPIQ